MRSGIKKGLVHLFTFVRSFDGHSTLYRHPVRDVGGIWCPESGELGRGGRVLAVVAAK